MEASRERPILSLVGPTAVGKTSFAIALALEIDGEIVNADALQAYRDLEIGTAKPTLVERAQVAHHLLEVLDPRETYSAGEFAVRARTVIADIEARGKVPIVVGGSGLYHRALFRGLAPTVPVDPEIRAELKRDLRRLGAAALHARLQEIDQEMAKSIDPNDGHRTVRALELKRASGRSQADLWRQQRDPASEGKVLPSVHSTVVQLGLTLPRTLLYDRIESRVAQMFADGWEDEVRDLIRRGVPESAPAFQAIGYREIVRVLRGEARREAAASDISQATRRYAKRQLTWFRRTPEVWWIDAERGVTRISELLVSLLAVPQLRERDRASRELGSR